jgi:hypothetical protein
MRAMMRAWLGGLGPAVAVVLCLGLCPCGVEAQSPPDIEATIQKTIEDAKLLAKQFLPPPDALGEAGIWKLPWQLPPTVPRRFESEEAYWKAFGEQGGIAGLTDEQARAAVDNFAGQFAAAGQAEGLGEREGVIMLLVKLRGQNAPPVVNMDYGLRSMTRASEQAKQEKAKQEKPKTQEQQQRALLEAFLAPFQGMSTEQLKDAFIREATLIKQRTELNYFASNNWQGVVETTNDQDFAKKGLWVGVVKVRLMLVDRQRVQEVADLTEADRPALQAQLDGTFKGVMNVMIQDEEQKIAAAEQEAVSNPDEGVRERIRQHVAELKQKLADSKAAAAKLSVSILPVRFGDNSYVIRIGGVSPEAMGLEMGMYTGWIRNGRALVEVTMGGNFPEARMTEAMKSFLTEMDKSTRGFAQ